MNRLDELYNDTNKKFTNIHSPISSNNMGQISYINDNEFENYTQIKKKIEDISKEVKKIEEKVLLIKPQLNESEKEKEKETETEINDGIIKIGNNIRLVKDDIVRMNNEIFAENKRDEKDNYEIINIKKNQCKYLSQSLSDTIIKYQKINEIVKKK